MSLEIIMNEFNTICRNRASFKPHKLLLMLSVINLFENDNNRGRHIYYNKKLLDYFTANFNKYARETDRNRPYAPFFHLRRHSFWDLQAHAGKSQDVQESNSVGGPGRLNELVEYAVLSDDLYSILTSEGDRPLFKKQLIQLLITHGISNNLNSNEFVSYINSLHCIDANSDGALAESQALNPLFSGIQVKHPWAERFYQDLKSASEKRHIILTGHAGDGKSTLAIELLKRLKDLDDDAILPNGLESKAEFELNGEKITVIKDLSEWSNDEQAQIFHEMLKGDRRFFLISNTGCLLNLFKQHKAELGKTEVEIESDLLTALDSGKASSLELGDLSIEINNLAMIDNIKLAIKLLSKLVNSSHWDICKKCESHEQCPIFRNVSILNNYQDRIFHRLELLFKRTYEYGNRLTMRQLSALFAYMLCSDLTCQKVAEKLKSGQKLLLEKYLFTNRLWGEIGGEIDIKATQLKSTAILNRQNFGTLHSPGLERYILLNATNQAFDLGIDELRNEFTRLLKSALSNELAGNDFLARKQIRRLVYFLYDPTEEHKEAFNKYQSCFLNSPMLLGYAQWEKDETKFKPKRSMILGQLFQVLQEQFSGIKVPEGNLPNKTLYITLNRRQNDTRQSSQIILGKLDFSSSFEVKMEKCNTGKALIYLRGKSIFKGIELELILPFLDYISLRKSGGIGNILQLSYVDRLENLKSKILQKIDLAEEGEMVLLKQGAGHTIYQQRLRIAEGRLEVSND